MERSPGLSAVWLASPCRRSRGKYHFQIVWNHDIYFMGHSVWRSTSHQDPCIFGNDPMVFAIYLYNGVLISAVTKTWTGTRTRTGMNKKVLLRERKRHTTRRVASAHFADWGGVPWVTPCPRSGRGVPHSADRGDPILLTRGYPHPRSGWGYLGVPLSWSWMGYPSPPRQQNGIPPIQTWDGIPPTPLPDLRWGTPPAPPASVDRLKILPSVILRMRAVMILYKPFTLRLKQDREEWVTYLTVLQPELLHLHERFCWT